MLRPYFTIQPEHVGLRFVKAFGKTWDMCNCIGYVQARDVDKRVYVFGDILQAENDEQRDKRLAA